MNDLIRNCLLILFCFSLSSCAVHSPMSEMLMFKQKKSKDDRSYSSIYSHALVGYTLDYYSSSEVNKYTKENYGNGTYDYSPAQTFTTNAIFMSDKTDNFAFSLAIGTAIGFDFTTKLFGQTYLTSAFNFHESVQGKVILQNRIYSGDPIGLSVGATFGRNYQTVLINAGCFCFVSEDYYTNTAGVRFVLLMNKRTLYGSARPFFYLTGSANYDLDMKLFYPRVGLSIGIY